MSETLALTGLSLAPAQVWRGVRLVPLIRDRPITDLRLDPVCYGEELGVVAEGKLQYTAFVPHAFVASWSKAGEPMAALGTQSRAVKGKKPSQFPVRFHHRLAKRVRERGKANQQLRFLPLHTAFEGYLALHFAGPDVAWKHYDAKALSEGMSPRVEWVAPGEWILGLEDALRTFEIVEGQVGVLLFVADALAAAFVVPHADDYRRLHRSLLGDFYGELIWRYSGMFHRAGEFASTIPEAKVASFDDLELELALVRARWAEFLHGMAAGLLVEPVTFERVYTMGQYTLERFLPGFSTARENHIGERIRGPGDELAYLKTFRLSQEQIRRGYLLSTLARHDWDTTAAAAAMSVPVHELHNRLYRAGFERLLPPSGR